jgi:hypothetical protein
VKRGGRGLASRGRGTELARAEAATKARTEPRTHALLKSSVNKIIWAQAGRVTEPGRYMFKFGWLTVTAEDLGIWKQYPNAAFTLLRTAPAEEAEDISPWHIRAAGKYLAQ